VNVITRQSYEQWVILFILVLISNLFLIQFVLHWQTWIQIIFPVRTTLYEPLLVLTREGWFSRRFQQFTFDTSNACTGEEACIQIQFYILFWKR
jgi:hypothetical protein